MGYSSLAEIKWERNREISVEKDKMSTKERRKYPRVETANSVSYVCIDEEGQQIEPGMGKTVNISRGGMLLETPKLIESEYILVATVDLEGKVIEIKGKVIHSTAVDSGWFRTGIQFLANNKQHGIVSVFVRGYHYRKEK
jgi:c-di-GMP-binding flagellar brake protein YcgR